MKPEDVRKALAASAGQVTLVLSDKSSITIAPRSWSLVGKTLITKSMGKDLLVSTNRITKIEPAKEAAPSVPSPRPVHSRVFPTKPGP